MASKRFLVALAVGAVAGTVAAVLSVWLRPISAPLEREVSMRELSLRGGVMYHGAEAEPFSGLMIDRYPSGQLKARSRLRCGVLDGISEGWYTNGVLQVREYYRAGVSHGVRNKWFSTGTNLSQATIENGKITGTFRRWHANGVLAEEIQMSNNLPHGLSCIYYPSGAFKVQARTENGKALEQHVWKDGENPALAR